MAKKGLTQTQAYLIIAAVSLIFIVAIAGFFTIPTLGKTSTVTKLKSSNSGSTASVFQALFITDSDGGTYWVYPPSNYQALSLLGYGAPNNAPMGYNQWNQISNIQSFIYFTPTLVDTSGVSNWTFTCFATIAIVGTYTSTGTVDNTTYGYLAQNTPIAYTSTSLTSGQLTYVISAGSANSALGANGAAINALISKITGTTTGEYKYIETLTDVGLTIGFNDGKIAVLSAPSTASNNLTWLIKMEG